MQTANDVGYSHADDASCSNTLYRKRPFEILVNKRSDVTTTVHTGRVDQGVSLNQNWGSNTLQFNRGPTAGEEQIHQVDVEALSSKGGGEKIQEEHGESLKWGQASLVRKDSYWQSNQRTINWTAGRSVLGK